MSEEIRAARQDLSVLRINRDPDRPRPGRRIAVVIVLAVLAVGGYVAWKASGVGVRKPVVETGLVRRVGTSEASAILSAAGYILPDRRANVSSKAFGRLEWLGVDVGSRVKRDDVIGRLAAADVQARVDEMRVAVTEAERERDRLKPIVEDGTIERERLDRALTLVELAKARLKSAEAELAYMEIRAPFDGVVVRKNAEVGETVGPTAGTGNAATAGSIVTLVDLTSLEMVADVNETNIGKIQEGQHVSVVADAHPDRTYRGVVRQIVPTADRAKGIVQVKVRLLQADEKLLPEMAARATFMREAAAADQGKRVIAPAAAVRQEGGRAVVFVLEGTRVRRVPVETGASGEDGVEIRSGLAGGEVVVVGGAQVEDGVEVTVQAPK